ncbi:MAG TPA: zf-HC2 domain-containing protein [Pyrinomonadaceae bacterium]|jgi:anti-sigma factor RsiW|nr:zf-HC2 domain-containing protein [Pyrinomonadaceae bacterium]
MTKRCLDEGLLQAYMDGELSGESAAEAASHVSSCDACAAALAGFEGDSAFFANAFAPEESINVPTEVLRARINAAVAQLEDARGFDRTRQNGRGFNGFLASLSGLFSFTPQRAAGFASLLAVVAAGLIYFAVIKKSGTTVTPQPSQEIAKQEGSKTAPNVQQPDVPPTAVAPAPEVFIPAEGPKKGAAQVASVNGPRRIVRKPEGPKPTATPEAGKEPALPGETDYRQAIASLETTIKMGGDATLKPALRVQYERNLAILDNAIEQTRKVAAQNPKDKDAVGFLMSAYQSKVELLTKVADQAQVSALGR